MAVGLMAAPSQAGDTSPAANAAFLAANKAKPGVVVRPSGLQYRIIKSGAGRTPKPTDTVRVFYRGTLIDGTVFDETKPGAPAEFPAGRLIAGWVEALSIMKEGDRWELVIPANLAYGERGTPGGPIGPNQTLVFEMELLEVK
jgi:FKBP-type peptidyl-prolyl cis-trans isomerase